MTTAKSYKTKEEIITARCDAHVKDVLHILSQSEDLSMSDVIVKSILEYHKRHFPDQSFFKEEQELFGRYGSKEGDLSVNRKKYLEEMLGEKHSHY